MSKIHIYGGGTFSFVRNHMAIAAPAFGNTAKRLHQLLSPLSELHLTKMADCNSHFVTNNDIESHLDIILKDSFVKCIIMNAALCDYDGKVGDVESGSHAQRLESRDGDLSMTLTPANKIISKIKEQRPDILVVGFKTTTNADIDTMEFKARRMNVDLVIANDTVTRQNIVVPKENIYENSIYCGSRETAYETLIGFMLDELDSNSPVKNIKHNGNFTSFYVEVKNIKGRKNAFNKAVQHLIKMGYSGDFRDSGWTQHYQDIYMVSLKK